MDVSPLGVNNCCCFKTDPRDSQKCPSTTKEAAEPTPSSNGVGIRVFTGDLELERPDECPFGYIKCCYDTYEEIQEVEKLADKTCLPLESNTQVESTEQWQQFCSEGTNVRQPQENKQCGERPGFYTIPNLPHGMASPEEFPWMCGIFDRNNQYLCACVIVPENFNNDITRGTSLILTVAHKVVNHNPGDLKIRMRDHYLCKDFKAPERQKFIDYDVDSISIYPDFSPERFNNNLAAIKTKGTIDTTQNGINAACLPTCGEMFDFTFQNGTGTRCWISGWGQDQNGHGLTPYLQKVDVPMYNTNRCRLRVREEIQKILPDTNIQLHPSELCAGGELGKDACNGDGGAPLVCQSESKRWFVMGLVAWGVDNRCGEYDLPGIYVRLSYFKDWINALSSKSDSAPKATALAGGELETGGIMPRDEIPVIIRSGI
eukprot:TCALIF_01230-PA protein Name:"Similar to OVCH2 Ovochymase-2 (Bufo japonicus)" AED:0.63 eAED:0.64 QI:0/0/0/0.5/1/1/6/0/430